MALCPKCKTILPPNCFGTGAPNDPRCVFCIRDTNTLYYGQFGEKNYTKGQAEQEYKEMLIDLANKPNIKNMIDITRQKEKEADAEDIVNV
jgi:hypothetical protein